MTVLILGGTRFIGRHMVDALLADGHDVSVFARGKSPDELPARVERIRGDRDDGVRGIAALKGRTWDACIDVSGYTPAQVRPSAELLAPRIGRYVFVSTVSVYDESPEVPVLETNPLLPEAAESVIEVTRDTYGPLKVTCERIVGEIYGERSTILRPQIVAGPFDPTGRHTYWVQRAMQDGPMLAPGDGTDDVQVVDARDIARFTSAVVARQIGGVFNMAGPRLTWAEFMRALGARDVIWVDGAILEGAGVSLAELPLFVPKTSTHSSVMHVSHARASAYGFTTTDPSVTIADVRAWISDHPVPPALSAERERELIARTRPA